jgi:TatD DNase family protein
VQERSRGVLARMAQVARELELPMILHAPQESAAAALGIIADAGVTRAVFHWHKSDDATTRAILEAGYFISITPEVVYRERDRALAGLVPLAQLLVETDGPWQYGDQFAGHATEPAMISDAIAAISSIKGISFEATCNATSDNARGLFGLRN